MGKTMEALRRLQSVEVQLADIRRRVRVSSAAVEVQQGRIDQLLAQAKTLHDTLQARQREAGAVELDLKQRDQQIAKLRALLNVAKTNKEYAAILTQLNTHKADNSKLEDEVLRLMQAADQVKAQVQELNLRIEQGKRYIDEVKASSSAETARLQVILDELEAKRAAAAAAVPPEALAVFTRVASTREGDAMAAIEVLGRRPPFEYVCGGCNMSIRAEHANALRTRDEVRFCDVCGRILYLEDQQAPQQA